MAMKNAEWIGSALGIAVKILFLKGKDCNESPPADDNLNAAQSLIRRNAQRIKQKTHRQEVMGLFGLSARFLNY
jgi:hypothetical protein